MSSYLALGKWDPPAVVYNGSGRGLSMYKMLSSMATFARNKTAYQLAGYSAAVAICLTVYLEVRGWGVTISAGQPWPKVKIAQLIMLLAWTVLPPVWLWYEYWFLYLKDHRPGHPLPMDLELFKYGQDLSAKMWIAGTSSVLVLYFWKDIRI